MAATVTPSDTELGAGRLSPATLDHLQRHFAADGVVILAGALRCSEQLLDAMARHAAHMVAAELRQPARGIRFGHDGYHLECGLPRTEEWTCAEVVANPLVEQAAVRLLDGAPAFLRLLTGNTACPGCGEQPLHMDGGGWSVSTAAEAAAAGLDWPPPPLKLVVHIPCSEGGATESNGATECWLGSHRQGVWRTGGNTKRASCGAAAGSATSGGRGTTRGGRVQRPARVPTRPC